MPVVRHAPGRRAGAVATRGDGRGDESEAGTAAGGVRKEEAASDIEKGRAEAGLRVGEGGVATGEAAAAGYGRRRRRGGRGARERESTSTTGAFQRLAPTSVIAFEYWLKLSDETKDFNGVGKPDQPSTALQKAVQILFGSIIGESFNFGLDEGAHVEWMKKYGFDIVDHLTHTQMDKKWNSIHGKTFFENANVPRLIKVELPKKSRLSFGR